MIVDYQIDQMVSYAFGHRGHGNIGFIDALYERMDDIKTLSVHYESVASFMADVYYWVIEQPTTTFMSCGPGSTNMSIGLGNLYLDPMPLFALMGKVLMS